MKTRWSQNFLTDKNIAVKTVDSLMLANQDTVLEIGAGKGILTELLLEKAQKVVAVEIDSALCDFLQARFGDRKNLELVQSDFLKFSLGGMRSAAKSPAQKMKVAGNLPYAVTSPILQKILDWRGWSVAVFMVQKEVGQRILARHGSREYGVLSVSVQARSVPQPVCVVSRNCFRPAPNVDSMVLRFTPKPNPFPKPKNEKNFFKTVRAAFAHRRKTILNSFSYALELSPPKIRTAIERAGLSCQSRAESLSVEDFQRLAGSLFG